VKSRGLGYVAGAIVVALLAGLMLGVPLSILAIFGLVVICPLAMFFMMRGMGGMGDDAPGTSGDREHTHDGRGSSR
jgi:hypothetical protein